MLRVQPALQAALLLAGSALTLASCARDATGYPSLARRPAERLTESSAPRTNEAPAVPLSGEVLARLDSLLAQARAADARFQSRIARARSAAAAAHGAQPGTEAWAQANVALSDLQVARSAGLVALAEIDRLYAERRITGEDAGPIAAARDAAGALAAAQDEIITGIRSQLIGS